MVCGEKAVLSGARVRWGVTGEGGGAGVKTVPPGKKNMSVLLCVRTNGRAREVGARVTRLGLQLPPRGGGPRRPPGAKAGGGLSIPAARAAAVLARPGPVQSAPGSDPRVPSAGPGERGAGGARSR